MELDKLSTAVSKKKKKVLTRCARLEATQSLSHWISERTVTNRHKTMENRATGLRVAFIVSNGQYESESKLKCSKPDAKLMYDLFKTVGYYFLISDDLFKICFVSRNWNSTSSHLLKTVVQTSL